MNEVPIRSESFFAETSLITEFPLAKLARERTREKIREKEEATRAENEARREAERQAKEKLLEPYRRNCMQAIRAASDAGHYQTPPIPFEDNTTATSEALRQVAAELRGAGYRVTTNATPKNPNDGRGLMLFTELVISWKEL